MSEEFKDLKGSGGKKGGSSTTNTNDNLFSQDFLEALIAISEGPIQGLKAGTATSLDNFLIGDTPLGNQSGKANFPSFNLSVFKGRDDDPAVRFAMGGLSSNMGVNTRLAYNIPVTRTTQSNLRGSINRIEVRLLFSQLVRQDDNGTYEAEAQFRIEYKPTNQPNWYLYSGENVSRVTGKTSAGAVKDFIIDVPLISDTDWDIRVTKLSPDNNDQGAKGTIVEMNWESAQLVQATSKQYDHLALVRLLGKASNQFSSVPEMSGIFEGLLCHIPTNYNPVTKTYDETTPWNGEFRFGFTDNPYWIIYELIVNPRFGLARYYLSVSANRYDFYRAAKWADEKVSIPGTGQTQARFTFNAYIKDQKSGIELLNYVAGSANGLVLDDGNGVVTLLTDQYRAPVKIFTPENITTDGFSYSATDVASRYNDVMVQFVNPDLGWTIDKRKATVDMSSYVERNGVIPLPFEAIGCTNEPEAIRKANYRAITANTEVMSVNFTTTRLGMFLKMFDTILVADPTSNWSAPGRFKSVVGNKINLRDPIYFADKALTNMKVQGFDQIYSVQVMPDNQGICYSLTVQGGTMPPQLPDRAVFTLENTLGLGIAKPFRVLRVEEDHSMGVADAFKIVAIEINVNKYPDADAGVISTPSQYSFVMPGEPVLPPELVLESGKFHMILNSDGTIIHRILASVKRPLNAFTDHYEIDYRESGSATYSTLVMYGDEDYISPVKDNVRYDVRLYAVSPLGRRSRAFLEHLNYLVVGKVEGLESPSGLSINCTDKGWELKWTPPTFPDQDGADVKYGVRELASWDANATLAAQRAQPPVYIPFLLAGNQRALVKYRDTSKNFSALASTIDFTIVVPRQPNVQVSQGYQSAALTWEDSTTSQPLRGYEIYRNTIGDFGSAVKVGETKATSYTVQESAPGTYFYWVIAWDLGFNQSPVAFVSVQILGRGVGAGVAFPSGQADGTPFYRTDLKALFTYDLASGKWRAVGTQKVAALPAVADSYEGQAVLYNGYLYYFTNGAWKSVSAETLIADGSLTLNKFAAGIEPVTVVSSLPTSKTTSQITLSTDGLLYHWDAAQGKYVKTIDASTITGTIVAVQLAAGVVDETKIASNVGLVKTVTSLPASKIAGVASVLFNNELYTWNGSAYSKAVAAANISGTLAGSQIAGGAIDNTKLASNMGMVQNVASLPAAKVSGVASVFFNNELYTWNGSAYSKAVSAGNLSGQITDAQVSSIAAAKLVGQLTDAQLSAISASKVAGQIVGTQITDGAISTAKMQAGSVSADILAAQAVTAGKLAVGDFENIIRNQRSVEGWNTVGTLEYSQGPSWNGWWGPLGESGDSALQFRLRNNTYGSPFPVKAGDQFYVKTLTVPAGGGLGMCGVGLGFIAYDANAEVVGYPKPAVRPPGIHGGHKAEGTYVVPSGVTTLQVFVLLDTYEDPTAPGYSHHFGNMEIRRKNTGSLIVDGAITANLVAANAIYAEAIQSNSVSARTIQTNAISADAIQANAIVSGKIAAGAVSAREISAGAVTTEKLSVASFSESLLMNGSFEDGTACWSLGNSNVPYFYVYDASSTGTGQGVYDGKNIARLTRLSSSDAVQMVSKAIPVKPGAQYRVRFAYRSLNGREVGFHMAVGASPTQPPSGYIDVNYANASGGLWAGLSAFNGVIVTNTEWAIYEAIYTAQSNHRWMSICPHNWSFPQSGNFQGEVHLDIDDVSIQEVISSALIQDGAITTPKLIAGAITADKLAVNSVSADAIQANAITTGKIAAGAIRADQIAAGAVTAEKLSIIQQGDNLLFNASLEERGTEYWNGNGIPVPVGWALSTYGGNIGSYWWGEGSATDGTKFLWLSRSGPNERMCLMSRAVPVTPGEKYVLRFKYYINGGATHMMPYVFTSSTKPASGFVTYNGSADDAHNTTILDDLYPAGFPQGSAYAVYEKVFTVAPGQQWLSLAIHHWEGVWEGPTFMHLDEFSLKKQINSATIQDGAITTPKLIAGAITADKLAVNSVTADAIQANAITANKLAVNSVSADAIQANAITTGKIAAGAVRADQIAAGSITTSKLAIGDFENLIPNGDGSSNDGWDNAGPPGFGNVDVAQDAAGWSSWWNRLGETGAYALTFRASNSYYGPIFTVKPGDQFYAKYLSVPTGGGTNLVDSALGLVLMDVNKTPLLLMTVAYRPAGTLGDNGAYKAEGSNTIDDPRIAYARVWFQIKTNTSYPDPSATYVGMHTANLEVRRKNRGSLIVDGAISANLLAANSVVAGKVAANAISADNIQAGAVVAGKIAANAVETVNLAANSIVADKIAASAITADKIAAGAITAGKIAAGAVTADKISVGALSAITAVVGNLEITSDPGGGWGWMRTYGKWLSDGANGTVMARHSNGDAFFETKAGGSRIVTHAADNYFELSWPQGSITNNGLVINQANVIGELQLQGNAVTVPGIVPFGSNRDVQNFNFFCPGGGTYPALVIFSANLGVNNQGGEGGEGSSPTGCSLSMNGVGSSIEGTGRRTNTFMTNVNAGNNTLQVSNPYGSGVATILVCKR